VRQTTRAAGREAGILPSLREGRDPLGFLLAAPLLSHQAEEHPRDDLTALPFGLFRFALALLQQRAEVVGHDEHAPLAILRCPRIESYFATFEIDVTPL
jgi:hypothetical protein